jgi:peptide deformylase
MRFSSTHRHVNSFIIVFLVVLLESMSAIRALVLQKAITRWNERVLLRNVPWTHVANFSRNRPVRKFAPTGLLLAMSAREDLEVDPGVVEGTSLRVLKYPHPALRAANALITPEELADGSIAKLAREMFLVMYAAQGVGLAAPQVGVNKRLMVYNESGDRTKWLQEVVLVNPVVTEVSDTTDIETEGCLSFPDMNGSVQRNKWIKVEAMNLKGKVIKKKFTGWEARIFQHEYDHLDGVVYIDRLVDEENRQKVAPRLAELVLDYDASLHGEPAL